MSGCGRASGPSAGFAGRSNAELARFLPVLADYPGLSWDVTLTVGASKYPAGLDVYPADAPVEPSGCGDIPFQRSDRIAASSEGFVPNGVAGDSGRASVRIMRDRPGADLIAESVDWAKRCHDFRVIYPGSGPQDPATAFPTAVSLLPSEKVDGNEVTRIHLTENREHRDQAEGSRESVVLLARVRGLVLVAVRHDSGRSGDDILSLTAKRLAADRQVSKPLSDKADTTYLSGRTDKEMQQLLPSALDVASEWTVRQSTPIVGERSGEGGRSDTTPSDCDRVPFGSDGWRPDTDRDFRQIAAVTAIREADQRTVSESVQLGIEKLGTSVIDETTFWAKQCASHTKAGHPVTVELAPATQLDGIDVTTVHVKGDSTNRIDDTTSLLRVRGVLVIVTPALPGKGSAVAQKTVENLRHAAFDTPSGPVYRGPYDRPPGEMKFPAPSAEATDALARVAKGNLVNPEQFHFGGYQPGDAKTRSPDYLHFRSPTGSIVCTWRRYALYCDVPHGTYPRTPKPVDLEGNWSDSIVNFGWDGIANGIATTDPIVYAESNALPYGSTIRLEEGPYPTECLMERDGLTCVEYSKRTGMHLSRDDLTPLVATEALAKDSRTEPK
ncbi:hypothetical protein FZI91_11335 [Mycobacterium sp. CBMA271]|nr:hypothetical protein [Mycobacteroides sp. CBMA 271]